MRHSYSAFLSLLTVAVSGCAVYAPTTPTVPLVRQAGDVEVQVTGHLAPGFSGSVSYSPVSHLVLSTTGGFNTNSSSTEYFRYRQAELAAGYYRYHNETCFGVLGGVGATHSYRGYDGISLAYASNNGQVDYEARYTRYFTQAYFAVIGDQTTGGFTARANMVDFRSLTRDGLPTTQRGKFYLETTGFARIGRDDVPLQLQLSGGYSVPFGSDAGVPRDEQRLTRSSVMVGIGLVFRPHLLWRAAE